MISLKSHPFFISSLAGLILLGNSGSAVCEYETHEKDNNARYANCFQVASHNTYALDLPGGNYNEVLKYTSAIEFDTYPFMGWEVTHRDGHRANCGDLKDCLNKVRQWHIHNSKHDPLTIFIEIKSETGFKVPDLNGMLCGPHAGQGDAVFGCGELFRPGDFKAPSLPGRKNMTLVNAAARNNWPTINDLRGKIIFVINSGDSDVINKYMDETTITQGENVNKKDASAFVMIPLSWKEDVLGQSKMQNIVFFNGECDDWKSYGNQVRHNNFLARGYKCGSDGQTFKDKWTKQYGINFVAYDDIETPYTKKDDWSGIDPQGVYKE